MDYVIFSSYGNDSIALIQKMKDLGKEGVFVAYSETGWGAPWWKSRVEQGEAFAESLGYLPVRIPSMGFVPLVRLKKAFPRNGIQFCTQELKIKPAMAWLAQVDPEEELVCCVGVRREESRSRAQWPEWTEESDKHGGRSLWAPLVRVLEPERNELIKRAGFDVLEHRSMECFPCINANKRDLRMVDKKRTERISKLEKEMGYTGKGKPIVMFRPYHHMGATGIEEVIKWANSSHGGYEPPSGGCDSGMCGL